MFIIINLNKRNTMSLDINKLVSEFNCTVEEIKELAGVFAGETKDMFEMIDFSLESNDFEHITMGAEAINIAAQNLHLYDIKEAAEQLISSSAAQDKEACSENFAAMQVAFSELEKIL